MLFERAMALILPCAAQLLIETFEAVAIVVSRQRAGEQVARLGEEDDDQAHDDADCGLVERLHQPLLRQGATLRRTAHDSEQFWPLADRPVQFVEQQFYRLTHLL